MTDGQKDSSLWRLVADEIVDREMNAIVSESEWLVESLFQKKHDMQRNQLSNLLATALETDSAAVVMDFVRYQMGRDSKCETWRVGQPSFGEELLKRLKELGQKAAGLIDVAVREYGIEPMKRESEEERIWMLLVRRFLGSLYRNFVYCDSEKKKEGRQ